jgi:hypothetical protein
MELALAAIDLVKEAVQQHGHQDQDRGGAEGEPQHRGRVAFPRRDDGVVVARDVQDQRHVAAELRRGKQLAFAVERRHAFEHMGTASGQSRHAPKELRVSYVRRTRRR